MDGNESRTDGSGTDLSRRNVLKKAGGTGVGLAVGVGAFAGSASAHEVSTIAFCGCSQVTVYGQLLLGSDAAADATGEGGYEAVLYCDGELVRRPLSGTQTRQNYDLDADPEIDDDCQIIAVEGTTYPHSDEHGTFRICNEHCPWNCAARGLHEQSSDWCDDPADIESGGGQGGVPLEEPIVIQCGGCGRPEPGHPGAGQPHGPHDDHPGKGHGNGRGKGRGGGRGRGRGKGRGRGNGR